MTSNITIDNDREQVLKLQNECRERFKVVRTKYHDLENKQELQRTRLNTKSKIKTHFNSSKKDDKMFGAVPSKTVNKWPYDKEFYKVNNQIMLKIIALDNS